MDNKRTAFDWVVFSLIHVVLIGGIGYAGFAIYGSRLGTWVCASAFVAGMVSMYLFAKDVPGETLMKVWLGICVAANAGYLVHNGAQAIGIEAYNAAQLKKFETGMNQAAQSSTRSIARQLGMTAKEASQIEKMFDNSVSTTAAILAFIELASGIVIFALASRRLANQAAAPKRSVGFPTTTSINLGPVAPAVAREDERPK